MARKVRVGDIIELALPNGRFAYGRVLRDAAVAFYASSSVVRNEPPDFGAGPAFTVGVYDQVLKSDCTKVISHIASSSEEDDWPPPMRVKDPISGRFSVYHKGAVRPASPEECEILEPAAVWDLEHIADRFAAIET